MWHVQELEAMTFNTRTSLADNGLAAGTIGI